MSGIFGSLNNYVNSNTARSLPISPYLKREQLCKALIPLDTNKQQQKTKQNKTKQNKKKEMFLRSEIQSCIIL